MSPKQSCTSTHSQASTGVSATWLRARDAALTPKTLCEAGLPQGLSTCHQTELCRAMGSLQEEGASEPWMPPTPPSSSPSKATQPPLASDFTGFWQILFRQVLRTAAGWSRLKGSLQTQQPTQALGPSSEIWKVAPPQLPNPRPIPRKGTRVMAYLWGLRHRNYSILIWMHLGLLGCDQNTK